MNDELERLLPQTLAREPAAARAFVDRLLPIVHSRVARLLARDTRARRARSEVEDITQDVLIALLEDDARALRAWDPGRGRSLASFVALLADHAAASTLRNAKRTPWREEPSEAEVIEAAAPSSHGTRGEPEKLAASREMLLAVSERLQGELTPRGVVLFRMLIVEERSVDEACVELDMKRDAIYAWRYRFSKLASRVLGELLFSARASDSPGRVRMEVGRG